MRALIVDDSPTARTQARVALDEVTSLLPLPLDVDEAEGGVEALRVLATADVDVLIVDLHMPGVHGLEVLAFWARRPSTASRVAVIVSTQVSDRDRSKALEIANVMFVEKPVTVAALATALSSLAEVRS